MSVAMALLTLFFHVQSNIEEISFHSLRLISATWISSKLLIFCFAKTMRKQSVWVRPHFLPLFAILCDCDNKCKASAIKFYLFCWGAALFIQNKYFGNERTLATLHHFLEKYSFAKSMAAKRRVSSSSFNAAYTPSASQSVISSFSSTLYSSASLGTWSRLTRRAPNSILLYIGMSVSNNSANYRCFNPCSSLMAFIFGPNMP